MYLFTWRSRFQKELGLAHHGLEVPFVFDNADAVPITGNRADKPELATSMSEAWISFAHTGNPSHTGIPEWGRYTSQHRETMIFDTPCRIEIDPDHEELEAWKDFPLDF
jgi:para-nitrobenzyl esterase